MATTSNNKNGMQYEQAGEIKSKSISLKTVDNMSTGRILAHLVNRHKVGLLFFWATIATAMAIAPSLIIGTIQSIF